MLLGQRRRNVGFRRGTATCPKQGVDQRCGNLGRIWAELLRIGQSWPVADGRDRPKREFPDHAMVEVSLSGELHGKVIQCIEDLHGNHVVQAIVKHMPSDSIDFVLRSVTDSAEKMSAHMYGCRVIQRLLEKCTQEQMSGLVEKAVVFLLWGTNKKPA